MALFVYPSEMMKEDAKAQGVSLAKVTEFCAEVEKCQSTSTFDRFPPPYLTRKKIWSFNNRLIAAEHTIGEHLIVILLRLVVKSSRDYENQFTNDSHAYAGPFLRRAIPDAEAWLAERTRMTPPPLLPKPSTPHQAFLWTDMAGDAAQDAVVFESYRWIASVGDSRVQDRLVYLPDLLLEVAGGKDRSPQIAVAKNDPKLRLAYCWFAAEQHLLLMDIVYAQDLDAAECYADCVSKGGGESSTDILRMTRRSYPLEICCDTDMWLAIQRDTASNMALSPEESAILRSVRTTSQEAGFPLFINGRAGSGKSTLLQYLFADYFAAWSHHVRDGQADPATIPLYLAASQELLTNAKSAVRGLLSLNAERLARGYRVDSALLRHLDMAFRTPVAYLADEMRSLAPEKRFERSHYVNYPRFRQAWLEQFGRDRRALRECGPQLSWHVIRTHIKGQSVDAELEPEDFLSLPRNEQTLSHERYKHVYHRVWKAWYEPYCKEMSLWDDQDLAACAAAKGFRGGHWALFCDEAQDFTRRQLEALHRCCGFSFMDLTPDEAGRVPFVFAGDPFQTLNPTGFRWEAVRAAFTEKIAGNLHRYSRRSHLPEINYRELTYNYRSSRHIVKLCNSIQAVRSLVMQEPTLRPQTTWHLDTSTPLPVFFPPSEPTVRDAIRRQTDLVLIVPCEEDGESDYVEEHETIRAIARRDTDGIPQNVLSPARAKGLEFNRVAIVGFGETPEAEELVRCLRDPEQLKNIKPDELLPLEYFLNKLYVACSRPRRRLFIIDDPSHLHDFWQFVLDQEFLLRLCDRLPAATEMWRDGVGQIAQGLPQHWDDDHNDPLETAGRFEADGEAKHDPYLLLQAAIQYELAGDKVRTASCRGRAYEYEGKPERAGELFFAGGNTERALKCFWQAEAFTRVVDVGKADPALRGRVEYRLAAALSAGSDISTDQVELLREVASQADADAAFREKMREKGWLSALQGVLAQVTSSLSKNADAQPFQWTAIVSVHRQLQAVGVPVDVEWQAAALQGAQQYAEVVDLLRHKPDSDIYRAAKVAILLGERGSGKEGKVTSEEKRMVGDALRIKGQLEDAAWWYLEAGWRDGLESCIQGVHNHATWQVIAPAVEALAKFATSSDQWEYVLNLLDGIGWPALPKKRAELVKRACAERDVTRCIFLPSLAVSDAVLREVPVVRDRLLQRAKECYRREERGWGTAQVRETRSVGAAIERVGKEIDALGFYEGVIEDKSAPPDLHDFCNRRWILCKLRQEARDRAADRRVQADRNKELAEKRLRTFGWTLADLGPDYPDRTLLSKGYAQAGNHTSLLTGPREEPRPIEESWQLNGLSFRHYSAGQRINIESQTGELARIDLAKRAVESGEVEVTATSPDQWFVPKWGLAVLFSGVDGHVTLRAGNEERQAPGR